MPSFGIINKISFTKLKFFCINILNNYPTWTNSFLCFLVLIICGKDTSIVKLWYIYTKIFLHFFSYVISLKQPFLTLYQSTHPVVALMHEDISCLIIKLLFIIIMKDMIVMNLSLNQLFQVKLNDQASQKPAPETLVGLQTISKFEGKDQVEEQKVLNFNKECRVFVIKAVENLRSRMAIGSTFVKHMSCLNLHRFEKLGVTIVVKRFANIVHSLTK